MNSLRNLVTPFCQPSYNSRALLVGLAIAFCFASDLAQCRADYETSLKPILNAYCVDCHGNDEANGDVNFQSIQSNQDVDAAFEIWESVVQHLRSETMPPADCDQPTDDERRRVYRWYEEFEANAPSRPAPFRPRRLSVAEYRNSLRSVVGFDLEVDVIEAEQTLTQRSMVVKLLPTDPPGDSGFKNDTHRNPLTELAWGQYSYLADAVLEELFDEQRRKALVELTGTEQIHPLTLQVAQHTIAEFAKRAYRRPASAESLRRIQQRLESADGDLLAALKLELKTVLMSPAFLYRGFLMDAAPGQTRVDGYEYAERLSYFLWADMPDGELAQLGAEGELFRADILRQQIRRMLRSGKSRALVDVFATEWLSLDQIEHVSNNPPLMDALRQQPAAFMHYLFTQQRPLLELVDSKVAFINPHTARMYGKDAKQLTRYRKPKGIEIERVPVQRIDLIETQERGGILTMPGVLAMNRGPIVRGTWVLERILGDHLPDPPANVGQVPPNRKGENLSFRQRFEQHRSQASCAICHDKIDPLGFALQTFGTGGQLIGSPNYKPSKAERNNPPKRDGIDTSGKLPSGESFANVQELKSILATSRKHDVVENIVKRTMSYALCRKLTVYDLKTVRRITDEMVDSDGTWEDLFYSIAASLPFQEAIVSGESK